jgi:hypothetical protein
MFMKYLCSIQLNNKAMKKDIVFHGLLLAQIAADFNEKGWEFSYNYGRTSIAHYFQWFIWVNGSLMHDGSIHLDERLEEDMAALESAVNTFMP